jgi:hypothetical protein
MGIMYGFSMLFGVEIGRRSFVFQFCSALLDLTMIGW